MAFPPVENSNWAFDYALLEDSPPPDPCFRWPYPDNAFPLPATPSAELDDFLQTPDCTKEHLSKKRSRSLASGSSDSKAYKEKVRRGRLNDKFQELSSILEPGRPLKTDKAAILSDAARLVIQLREEVETLKQSYDDLQGKVNELKAEKNELREDRSKLKAEKEKLEEQIKSLSIPPGFAVHPHHVHAPFATPSQVIGSKLVPFVGYPGFHMWQLMPPADDHTDTAPTA